MNRMFQGRWLILPLLAVLSFTACKKELRLADYEGPATDAYTFVAKNMTVDFVEEDDLHLLVMRRGGDNLSATNLPLGITYKGKGAAKEFSEIFMSGVVEFAEGSRDGYLNLDLDLSKLKNIMGDFTFQAAVDLPTDKFAITAITSTTIVPKYKVNLEWGEHPTVKEVLYTDNFFYENEKLPIQYCKIRDFHFWKIEKLWGNTNLDFCIDANSGKVLIDNYVYVLTLDGMDIGVQFGDIQLNSADGTPNFELKFQYYVPGEGAFPPEKGFIKPAS